MSGAIYFQRVSNLAPSAAQFREIDMLGVHFQYSCCLAVVRSSFAYGRSCLVDSGCRSAMKMHGCAQSTSSTYWFLSKTSSFPSHVQTHQQTTRVTLLWSLYPDMCWRTVWWLLQKGKPFTLIHWSVLDSHLGVRFLHDCIYKVKSTCYYIYDVT